MKNKKAVISILAGIIMVGTIIAWLMFGGKAPVSVDLGNGISAQVNASLKNSVLKREKEGKLLWQFTVDEVVNDKQKNLAYLKGITGKVYRNDGSYIDIIAEKGVAEISDNNFSLEGNVKAVINSGGELYADKITWNQNKELITGNGHVKIIKDAWTATADMAMTTSAFENIRLKGNAKVEKGGK